MSPSSVLPRLFAPRSSKRVCAASVAAMHENRASCLHERHARGGAQRAADVGGLT